MVDPREREPRIPSFRIVVEEPQRLFERIQRPHIEGSTKSPVIAIGSLRSSGLLSEMTLKVGSATPDTIVLTENVNFNFGWYMSFEAIYRDPALMYWTRNEASQMCDHLKSIYGEPSISLITREGGYRTVRLKDNPDSIRFDIDLGWESKTMARKKQVKFVDRVLRSKEYPLIRDAFRDALKQIKQQLDKYRNRLNSMPNYLLAEMTALGRVGIADFLIPFGTPEDFNRKMQKWTQLLENVVTGAAQIKGVNQAETLYIRYPTRH